MKTRKFQCSQWIPRPLDEVFAFFADAGNLQVITPKWVSFEIVTKPPIVMRAGTIIDYSLRLRGFPVKWKTEITVWEPPRRFVDVQRKGPYRVWIHEHLFSELDGGTEVTDRVEYASPLGWLVDPLFVSRDVRRIFSYRRQELEKIFNTSL